MQRITPCLWFDGNAEEAVKFYISIFKNSKIDAVSRYGEAGARASGRPGGTGMTIAFRLEGQPFLALNGGPISPSHPPSRSSPTARPGTRSTRSGASSARVAGPASAAGSRTSSGCRGRPVPADIGKLVHNSSNGKADRVMQTILGMKQIGVATLKRSAT